MRDERGRLWIAKFPSRAADDDIGAWEGVVHALAERAGVDVPEAQLRRFGSARSADRGHHTYLSRRFDRDERGRRHHFASALTLLDRVDGDDAEAGASYVELAELLMRIGARVAPDLEQLWRRIVFSMCVSNTDDHLRNHGFVLQARGWQLAPAYDMNPDPDGDGLKLNVSEMDNAQDLELALSTAPAFRITSKRARAILEAVTTAVRDWRAIAKEHGLSRTAQDRMQRAFRLVER